MVKKVLPLIFIILSLIALAISLHLTQDSPPKIALEGDLNNNGLKEEYLLENFRLKVYENKELIWESPKDYKVDQLSIGDVTGDGKGNLAICVWKEGSFGKYRPFWHVDKDDEYKHHLFIYEFRDGTYKPKWFSSSLKRPFIHMEITEGNDLLVIESGYKKGPFGKYIIDKNASTEAKLWKWENWGFTLVLFPGELDQEYAK